MGARWLAAVMALLAGTAVAAPRCPIPGDPVHWVVDYCMLTLQTDDEIPASDCIARERLARFGSACAAKAHFKREMCRLLRPPDAPASVIELCVRDPGVMGRTVREGGVGGR